MEIFMPYLLSLLLLPLSLYLISFIRKKGSGNPRNLPPGFTGWPVIGENMDYGILGTKQFVKMRMEKHSPDIFKTSLLGEKMAVICGPRGNKFVFTNENKLVASWFPTSVRKLIFPGLDDGTYKEVMAFTHGIYYDFQHRGVLKQYTPVMDSSAREVLDDGWMPNTVVKVLPSSMKYTFKVSCWLFLNIPGSSERLLENYTLLTDGMVSLPVDVPGMAFNRAMKGARAVRGEVMEIIRSRREEMMMENKGRERRDILSKLLLNEYGKNLSDAMIANVVIALLFASQFSTSAAVTVVLHFLAQLPHVYDKVLEDEIKQMEIAKSKGGPDEKLTLEDVEKMKYSWNVVRESFRLVPPLPGGFKEAIAEFTYAGFTIPKGWKVFWTAHSSHNNPNYFPEPEKFDPSRFEGRGPAPYMFVPFGGGPNICPGREFAKISILVMMHNVVTRFRLEKAIPSEKMVFRGRATPAHGLPVHLHPHKK